MVTSQAQNLVSERSLSFVSTGLVPVVILPVKIIIKQWVTSGVNKGNAKKEVTVKTT